MHWLYLWQWFVVAATVVADAAVALPLPPKTVPMTLPKFVKIAPQQLSWLSSEDKTEF